MNSILDLSKEDYYRFFHLQQNYSRATDSKRAERLMDWLMFTMDKLGYEATSAIIKKETTADPMAQLIMLTAVRHHVEKAKTALVKVSNQ